MKPSPIVFLTLFLSISCICITNVYAAEGFYYAYTDPSAADAQEYIISQNNVEIRHESQVTYWKPEFGDVTKESTTPGTIVYRFHFDRTINNAFLTMYAVSYHWAYSQGHTYLYASEDGIYWSHKLAEAAPPPYGMASYAYYDAPLPEELLHKNSIYLKAVLYSFGSQAYLGGAYTNTAQHSRYQHGSEVPTFIFSVEFDEWIVGITGIKTEYTDEDGKLITEDHLIPGKSSTIDVTIKNCTTNIVNSRLSFGLKVAGNIETIGQADHDLEAGPNTITTTTTTVQTPSNAPQGLRQLTIVLGDRATQELLDTYEKSVLVGIRGYIQGAIGLLIGFGVPGSP